MSKSPILVARWDLEGHTIGMKVTISLPKTLSSSADDLARRERKTRSQLYRDAIVEYLARHDVDGLTDRMDRLCEQLDSSLDEDLAAAAAATLERSDW